MFQHVYYDSLPTSFFDRVDVLRALLALQDLLSSDEIDFIVQFLCLK